MKITLNTPTSILKKQENEKTFNNSLLSAENSRWPSIEEYLKNSNKVILPVGSQEQHGRHMPLSVDWMIPYALAKLVSERSGAFCLSPVCYGLSSLHSAYPGTVSLKPGTLVSIYKDIIEDLYRQSLSQILIINGHGGNTNALNSALSVLVQEAKDLRVKVYQWWMIPRVQEICLRSFGELDSHAGPAETSVMLHLFPESVVMEEATDNSSDFLPFYPNPDQIRELYPHGVMQNDSTRADPILGKEIVAVCVDFFLEELNCEDR